MANKEEKSSKIGVKIPVFSVLKKGSVLKNIFLSGPGGEIREEQENEAILIGRHPECHVILDHPSISRFHLEIRAKPSLQQISVVDRSSVHGTWISGTRIEPNVPVDLREGDFIKLGASTREYRFHWLSLNEAFQMENNPLLPTLLEEKEESHQDEICQNLVTSDQSEEREETPQDPLLSESIGSIKRGSSSRSILSRRIKSKSISSLTIQTGNSKKNVVSDKENCEALFAKLGASVIGGESEEKFDFDKENAPIVREEEMCRDLIANLGEENGGHVREEIDCKVLFAKLGATVIGLDDEENFCSDKENMTPQGCKLGEKTMKLSENSRVKVKSASILGEFSQNFKERELESDFFGSDSKRVNKGENSVCILGEVKQNSGMKENGNCSKSAKKSGKEKCSLRKNSILGNLDMNEYEYFDSDKENLTPQAAKSAKKSGKTVCILGESKQINKKSSLKGPKIKKMEKGNSDRGKAVCIFGETKQNSENESSPARALLKKLDFKGAEEENCEIFYSDKENLTSSSSRVARKLKQTLLENQVEVSPVRALFKNVDFKGAEEENCEIFSSDKENWTPASSTVARKLKQPFSENLAKVEKEISKKKNEDRVPFGVLFSESQYNNSLNCGPGDQVREKKAERKFWNMIVDTGCLLDEESFKALKLLQGLKGTHLIIPNIVIRELDCMKRRENLFTRPNKASKILKWIEECMGRETESWWIHVQSSSETVPVAPTPPVTPTSLFSTNNTTGFSEKVFSPCGGYMEIVTPTSEDHVLECALFFKKLRRNTEIVIVSSSTTLKIKAMAEGLMCEEAKEFRESLVNPFSKRFMWASSSPRGPTWSNDDMAEIAEDCNGRNCSSSNPVFVRRPAIKAAEAVKGLKLILHHNSHYGMVV